MGFFLLKKGKGYRELGGGGVPFPNPPLITM